MTSLPGLKDGDFPTKHYAGYIPVEGGYFFYWLFESSRSDPASDPLVIWLNGGPVSRADRSEFQRPLRCTCNCA